MSLRPQLSFLSVKVVVAILLVGFSTNTAKVTAAETNTTVERTPAFYLALRTIYDQLVIIQALVEEFRQEEAVRLQNMAISTPEGTITSVSVTVDYAAKSSGVLVEYREGTNQTLSVPKVVEKEIASSLANQLGVTVKQVSPLLKFNYVNGDTLVEIVVALKNSRSITITKVFADSSTKQQVVPSADIDEIIADDFFGMTSVYQAFYDDYLAKIKKGEKPTEVVSFVANLIDLQPEVVAPIIRFTY